MHNQIYRFFHPDGHPYDDRPLSRLRDFLFRWHLVVKDCGWVVWWNRWTRHYLWIREEK